MLATSSPRVGKVAAFVRPIVASLVALATSLVAPLAARASETDIVLPDFRSATFLGGMNGHTVLLIGMLVSLVGFVFGILMYSQIRNLPVHRSMSEISELIYETCKTYLLTQIKFILLLELFIGAIIFVYFWGLRHLEIPKVLTILLFSLIGIAGSCGVAWFGIRINTFANSRTAFASLGGKPFPTYAIPLKAGMSIGMVLISTELLI
ncbi:MAG: sodium/proton-translocating pyrophosphatase, partial [Alphaproteobacteria bacterium]